MGFLHINIFHLYFFVFLLFYNQPQMKKKLHLIPALLLFFLYSYTAFAQPITQYTQFNGPYDFVAIGNTLNEAENNTGYCDILTSSSADLNLDPDHTVIAAYLYWSGSGSLAQADLDVELNGTPFSAERLFEFELLS